MGLPFWEMPDRLTLGGRSYPINTDFRVGIRIRQMFWEPYYQKRQACLLDAVRQLLFYDAVLGDVTEAELLCTVLWYLLDGRMTEERILRRLTGDGNAVLLSWQSDRAEAVFSYLWDMPAVYAAFLASYHIDLLTENMHLWQFDALFASLPEDCMLCRAMTLRAVSADAAEDGDSRAALAAQKLAVRIPDDNTLHRLCFAQSGDAIHCSFAKQKKTGDGIRDAEQVCGGVYPDGVGQPEIHSTA